MKKNQNINLNDSKKKQQYAKPSMQTVNTSPTGFLCISGEWGLRD